MQMVQCAYMKRNQDRGFFCGLICYSLSRAARLDLFSIYRGILVVAAWKKPFFSTGTNQIIDTRGCTAKIHN